MHQPRFHSEESKTDRLAPLGRALFTAGLVLLILRGLTLTTTMPGLPVFWYANQPLWVIIAIGLTGLGWRILWRSPIGSSQPWQPSIRGRRFHSVTLYVSEGCHLCHDAAAMLTAYEKWLPIVREIDIHSDPKLAEQFSTCVPVVVFDGKVRFRGRIEETLLRRLIEGTPPVLPSP